MVSCQNQGHNQLDRDVSKEKTAFQTSGQWKPVTDVRADVAIVYGAGDRPARDGRPAMTFEERVQTWRDRGYTTHFMTGIAWGNYQDYFTGEWDGKWHLDEGQKTVKGDTIWHGRMVPYIVPSLNFIEYIKQKHVKKVIDAGIDAIHMEEPEFWMRAGYSDAFKREWEEYYGFPWRPQHESPENTYLSNKLKYHLYYRALDEVFTFAKEYGKSKGMNVRCYVPTHSLVNYSSWQIVSPEASLASLPAMDGYIAQVWTGTSREPTYFDGLKKERVFENAFLEYGSMESMTRPTGRKMFFLTDPIEDWPRDWVDYKKNYQATFSAQLLYPMIADYEVMPWPDRIYEGLYKTCDTCTTKERIPRFYSTQMQVMINTLNDMPRSENKVSGSHGIGVLMSNSLMFQRFPTHDGYDDPQFSNFYGQTLPLLKRGIPVSTVHIENVGYPDTWKDLKVLVMSYANMKPMKAEYHQFIADWVKNGGVLVYCGKDIDPYQTVMEWWNSDGNSYKAPSQHLFELMKLGTDTPGTGEYACGKGKVYVIREEPKEFVLNANYDSNYFETIKKAFETTPNGGQLETKNSLYLERGPYMIAAVMDESISNDPMTLKGVFIDLFDPALPVLTEKSVIPGEQAFLYNVEFIKGKSKPAVLCGASRIYDEVSKRGFYSFVAKSPLETNNVSRVLLPKKPSEVVVKNPAGEVITNAEHAWDDTSGTCLLKFENDPDGILVEIKW
ncbi:MAG: hypothetical protein PHQ77_02645 [Proteiniphilum sp.]|jgi:hypothetical protein|nr:hypothetical protein [Proteiniphilum sp.]